MTLVRCKLGYAETSVGPTIYVFQRDRFDRFVALVPSAEHVEILVSCGVYETVPEIPPGAAPAVLNTITKPETVQPPLLFIPDGWQRDRAYEDGDWLIHGQPYMATAAHTADETNEPGAGPAWEKVWKANPFGGLVAEATIQRVQQATPPAEQAAEQPSDDADKGSAPSQQQDDDKPEAPVITDIKGIGPSTQSKLAEAGFTEVAQIAALSENDADALDTLLNLRGKIKAEEWVAQAKALMGSPATE